MAWKKTMQVFQTDGAPPSSGSSILAIIGWTQNNKPALRNNVAANNAVMLPNARSLPHHAVNQGTITLFAERQVAVARSASWARSSGNRSVTIPAKGNRSPVAPRNSRAALRWRGSLDHDPKT